MCQTLHFIFRKHTIMHSTFYQGPYDVLKKKVTKTISVWRVIYMEITTRAQRYAIILPGLQQKIFKKRRYLRQGLKNEIFKVNKRVRHSRKKEECWQKQEA